MSYTVTITQTNVPLSVSIHSEVKELDPTTGAIVRRMYRSEDVFVPAEDGDMQRAFFCDDDTTYISITKLPLAVNGLHDYQAAAQAQIVSTRDEETER